MKKFWTIAALALLLPAGALALEEGRVETSGQFTAGVQQVDLDPNSAKFNEYRDIRDGFYLYDLRFEGVDTEAGRYLELGGKNLIRDDQHIRFGLGSYGTWGLEVERNEIPHRLSNKAKTPYIDQGNGLFTVASPVLDAPIVGIPNNAANKADMLANDQATADWLETHLQATDLGTQRDKTSATLQYSPLEALKFRLTYSDERKDGNKITYGPIGNRPPNTLNIQFTEPVDYVTREVKFEAEYNRDRFQSLFTYLISDFQNDTETLRWQNIWAFDPENPAGFTQASSAGGTQRLATLGQRALAPDNRYQNASLSFGIDLPLASRLAATAAYSRSEQDETLLPYSSSDFGSAVTAFSSTASLPRTKADAEIETKLFNVDYTINPVSRMNLRAFYRFYDLDNNTQVDDWRYVTSDALPNAQATSGLPTYKNMRTNLAFAYDQQNYGLDAAYSLAFWRTTLGLGYEREEIDRDFREADTDENMFNASLRTRPADWLSLRAKYHFGDREADAYNTFVTAASYWYAAGDQGTDNDNPKFTFTNHPDMRKSDVSDRERHQVDVAATVMPAENLDLTASYRWREDDFDSGVQPTQPLAGSPIAGIETNATSPGDQLGLLEMETVRYALDASYAPTARLTLTAFGARETIESKQRGLEFDENHKQDPSVRLDQDLGAWTEARGQWVAVTDDRTNSVGAGVGYELVPGKLNFLADYTLSRGKVDIDYSGFGSPTSLIRPSGAERTDTNQFAFRNPPTVTHKQYTINATLEYQVVKNLVFGLHYLFDYYRISDWMQEADTPWFESVGSEFLLRDTSESHQWGNRLVNLGSTLGPSYDAHVGYLTMTYKF